MIPVSSFNCDTPISGFHWTSWTFLSIFSYSYSMKVAIYFEFNSDSGNILFHSSRWLFKNIELRRILCLLLPKTILKEVFAKNERGYRLKSKNIPWWLLIILLLSVACIRRKWLTRLIPNSQSCIIPFRSLAARCLSSQCFCMIPLGRDT